MDLSQILQVFPETWKNSNTYYLQLAGGCVVDPGAEKPEEVDFPAWILATHAHYDHLRSIDSWMGPNTKFCCLQEDLWMLDDMEANASKMFAHARTFPQPQVVLQAGHRLDLDDEYYFEVWASPGHTEGSACFLLKQKQGDKAQDILLFTGDTVFSNNIGRSDLLGGDPHKMHTSITDLKTKLEALDPDLPVLAGHGPMSQVGKVLHENPFFRDHGLI